MPALLLPSTVLAAVLAATRVAIVASSTTAPGQVALRYAERDASRVAGVLRELGGFQQVWTLRDPAPADWERVFDRVEQLAVGGDALELLVYYSGHADAEGLLLGPERLSYRRLRWRLDHASAGVRVLILDACNSGGAARPKGGRPSEGFPVDAVAPPAVNGSAILAASTAAELAQESSEIEASFFTHHLVSALRGSGDRDGNGLVTLAEAYDYAASRTVNATLSSFWGPQHPVYEYQLSGTGDVVLTRVGGAGSALSFPAGEATRYFVASAAREVVAEVVAHPTRRTRLVLPPGKYRLVRRDGRQTSAAVIEVLAGRDQPIEGAAFRETPVELALAKGRRGTEGSELTLGLALTALGPGALGASGELGAGYAWRGSEWVVGSYVGVGQSSGSVSGIAYRLRRSNALALLLRRLPAAYLELRAGAAAGVTLLQQEVESIGHSGLAPVALGAVALGVPLSDRVSLQTWWALGVEVPRVGGRLRLEPEARASLGLLVLP